MNGVLSHDVLPAKYFNKFVMKISLTNIHVIYHMKASDVYIHIKHKSEMST